MDDQDYYIPRRLNDVPRLFFWDMDVACIFLAFLMLGLLVGSTTLGFLAAGCGGYWFGKAKSGRHPAYTIHLAYWYLPMTSGMDAMPPSHIREMNG
ncbi:type IV conjugative transfer system protein TraL [Ramlibacter humi]|uniref:Type IV conjugative transfer system protein TraL n=1 Tax=Ramlibacter humi TaxID=2530451 RepID=A0A4Z0BQ21_9BURK|nr:type IV conjugative transfer system protein TraL [Ramlibacter humi]TFZ00089.1 type IV conjugative transfer system protein TraL [Ramlibacter humi]